MKSCSCTGKMILCIDSLYEQHRPIKTPPSVKNRHGREWLPWLSHTFLKSISEPLKLPRWASLHFWNETQITGSLNILSQQPLAIDFIHKVTTWLGGGGDYCTPSIQNTVSKTYWQVITRNLSRRVFVLIPICTELIFLRHSRQGR